ncbi:hypothetical protein Ae201684P_012832 [Aphanomyces euteiches]|nr:hypothetical protein Ae201684P_012832 [Aphanomyces euteiches]
MDAVSFGMRDVEPQGIPHDIWTRIRFLPIPTREQCAGASRGWVPSQWPPEDNAFLTLPRSECLFGAPPELLDAPGDDLLLCLYDILTHYFCGMDYYIIRAEAHPAACPVFFSWTIWK